MNIIKDSSKHPRNTSKPASMLFQLPNIAAHSRSTVLPAIRRLQIIAVLFAIVWLVFSIVISDIIIADKFRQEIDMQKKTAQSEATFIAQLVDKELHTAEQLAITLSHETDILSLLQSAHGQAGALHEMTAAQRKQFLKLQAPTATVNGLFRRLSDDVDLMSVFLLDANANCIANSYLVLPNDEIKGCLGGNYASRHYFQQAKSQGHGRQFAVGKKIPIPSLFFAHAATKEQQFMGAVVVRLNAKKLIEDFNMLASTTWVVDRLGVIISSTHEASIFQHIGARFAPKPSSAELKNTYALKTQAELALKPASHYPKTLGLWDFGQQTLVIARINVQGQDFEIWHALDVKQSIVLAEQNWYLAITIIIAGLLIILIIERVTDYHQRSLSHLDNLAQVNRSLEKASKQLYSIAITDHLTQISSRGYFLQRLEEELARVQKENRPFCLLQIDIDHFKRINDSLGHAAGDAAICHMANLCRKTIRDADLLGRMGGEEFSIGLVDCDKNTALRLAELLRAACEKTPLKYKKHDIDFTCSIGVASFTGQQEPDELLTAADKALYVAKNSGRNCVKYSENTSLQHFVV